MEDAAVFLGAVELDKVTGLCVQRPLPTGARGHVKKVLWLELGSSRESLPLQGIGLRSEAEQGGQVPSLSAGQCNKDQESQKGSFLKNGNPFQRGRWMSSLWG